MELPAWVSSKEDILRWRDSYDENEDSFTGGLEETLRGKFQERKHATYDDIQSVFEWKFAEMPGRLKRSLNLLSTVNPDLIKNVSARAFAITDDSARLRQLRHIKGVGVAVASVILAFYDPDTYGIIDIHSWRELFGGTRQVFDASDFLRFTEELRRLAAIHGLPAREVEKALFRKNRVQPDSSKNLKL
ncbi:MAG: hypothetical protein WAN17_07515 [Candidatus Sulfotelmatobacter sp.]